MSDDLKPCPWCGGPAHFKSFTDGFIRTRYSVGCSTSGCMGMDTVISYRTREEAAGAWNRRPVDVGDDEVRGSR